MLEREEYIEQAYFWRTMRERQLDGVPAQEILAQVQQELLSTTKLPMALDFLLGEIKHNGKLSEGMRLVSHYFTPFQAFVMTRAEDDKSRFDGLIALQILESEAAYRAAENASPAGLFLFQFECLARNRLGYDDGMRAIAADPMYPDDWKAWMASARQHLGMTDLSDLLYARSEYAAEEKRRVTRDPNWQSPISLLFGVREGRIAKANRGKDPLFMFAALQRQLGYPAVPRPRVSNEERIIHPVIEQRFQIIEKRMQIIEQEQKGGLDLSQFYVKGGGSAASPKPE